MESSENNDYYKHFGLSRSTTPEEIRKVYWRLALHHHPDKKPRQSAGGDRQTNSSVSRPPWRPSVTSRREPPTTESAANEKTREGKMRVGEKK